jgi:hypothetical protein
MERGEQIGSDCNDGDEFLENFDWIWECREIFYSVSYQGGAEVGYLSDLSQIIYFFNRKELNKTIIRAIEM